MAKYRIRGVEREGHKGVWRAGRLWPSSPVDIEVLEGVEEIFPDNDLQDLLKKPKADRPAYVYELGPSVDKPDAPRRIARKPNVLGENAFAQLQADGRVSINPLDGPIAPVAVQEEIRKRDAEIANLRAQLEAMQHEAQARASVGARKARAADADADPDDDDEDDDEDSDVAVALRTENLDQKGRIAELERELVAARGTPAPVRPPEEKAPPVAPVPAPAAPAPAPTPTETPRPAKPAKAPR